MSLFNNIAGIDPGRDGALVIMSLEAQILLIRAFSKLNGPGVMEVIFDVCNGKYGRVAFFKESFAAYGLDAMRACNVGHAHGILDAAFYIKACDVFEVSPHEWVKVIHGNMRKELKPKIRNLDRVKELFPAAELKAPKGRTPHGGIVDAILIAEYGRRKIVCSETG